MTHHDTRVSIMENVCVKKTLFNNKKAALLVVSSMLSLAISSSAASY
jgi:post-segregation antitoxin (ccd killing protein)